MSTELPPFDPVSCSLDGLTLVEASAGTGKTWSISTLAVRLVLEARLRADQLLIVTFTRAASRELRDRVRSRLREALDACRGDGPAADDKLGQIVAPHRGDPDAVGRLAVALRDLDQAVITTIHSFCQLALSRWAFESGGRFGVELDGDQSAARADLVQDAWVRRTTRASDLQLSALGASPPGAWTKAVEEAGRFPDLRILPERRDVTLDERIGDGVAAARDALAALWADEDKRAAATALLEDNKVVDHRRLNAKARPRLYAALDRVADLDPVQGRLTDLDEVVPWQRFAPDDEKPLHKDADRLLADPVIAALRDLQDALAARTALADQWAVQQVVALARDGAETLRRQRRARGTLDYGDLIFELDRALGGPSGAALAAVIRAELPCALIDEFQDTDQLQYRIFRRIYLGDATPGADDHVDTVGDTRLFLVGDPKQAIYAFRGADIHGYLQAARDAAAHRRTMGRNWRSDGRLVTAVGQLFGRARQPFGYPEIDYVDVDAQHADRSGALVDGDVPLEILFVPYVKGENGSQGTVTTSWLTTRGFDALAARVARLLESDATVPDDDAPGGERPLRPRDVAVLCGWTRDLKAMGRALARRGIRSVRATDEDVWSSAEAGHLLGLLRAVLDPRRETLVRTALSGPILCRTAEEVVALAEQDTALATGTDDTTPASWDAWIVVLRQAREQWAEQGFLRALRGLLATGDVLERMLARPDSERRLTNLQHLSELLHELSVREHLGPEGLLARLEHLHTQAEGRTESEDAQLRLESDRDAVVLSTIHRSKGLEYPVVILPTLWRGAFQPDGTEPVLFYDGDGRISMDLGSADLGAHLARAFEKSYTEQMRLLYVALTRARHRMVVLWARVGGLGASAMAGLLHPPPGDAPLTVDTAPAHVGALEDDGIRADLDALVAAAGGTIAWAPLDLDADDRFADPGDDRPDAVAPRTFTHRIPQLWRTSSFTGLVRRAHEARYDAQRLGSVEEEEAPDMDGLDLGPLPAASRAQAAAGDAAEDAAATLPDAVLDQPCLLRGLPRGDRTGSAIHEVLEHIDFQAAVGDDQPMAPDGTPTPHLLDHVTERLALHRVGEAPQALQASRDLHRVLRTPMPGGPRLADLVRRDRVDELSFLLPVGPTLTPARLARAMAVETDADPLTRQAAERVAELGFMALQGYLNGFIDLVFRHDGRFHVVDYKTNHLGDTLRDYTPAALGHAMVHANYLLQLHLYVVATHRFLAGRIADYDYETHMGPAMYLFLRGMTPRTGAALGTFRIAVPAARVQALDALFAAPAASEVA